MGKFEKCIMYKCPVCGEFFKKYQSAHEHMKRKHKDISSRNIIRISIKDFKIIETKTEDKEEQND